MFSNEKSVRMYERERERERERENNINIILEKDLFLLIA